jgi:hypothetical protein
MIDDPPLYGAVQAIDMEVKVEAVLVGASGALGGAAAIIETLLD